MAGKIKHGQFGPKPKKEVSEMISGNCIAITLGVFVGNWLFVPFLYSFVPLPPEYKKNYTQGFFVGIIAVLLMLCVGLTGII